MTSLFTELKRRKVFRVAAVYGVVTWILMQVADVLLGNFAAPEWVFRSFAALLALGFPVALVLAWAFDLTPAGLQRDITASAPGEPLTARPLGAGTAALALVGVLALALVGWFVIGGTGTSASGSASTEPGRSIAVLAFADLSPEADQEYFADGIAEEILNALVRIEGLKVAGRTSSFHFKGREDDLRAIGATLGVAHILEGSVRKQGNRVRITAQLVRSDNGFRLWSETYDRELADVFAIQEEISRAIVDALGPLLGDGAAGSLARAAGTTDSRAHDLYLLGLRDWHRRGDAQLRAALERFREAVRLDPDYAAAHAGMALTYAVLPVYGSFPVDEAVREGKAAARRALELRPDLPEPHAALGQIAQNWEWDWTAAERAYGRAVQLNPNYATAYMWRCELLTILGRHAEAMRACRTGLDLDPLAPVAHNQVGSAFLWSNHQDSARASFHRALELDRNFQIAADNLALSYLVEKDYDGWLLASQQAAASAEDRQFYEVLHAGWSRPLDPGAKTAARSAIEAFRREARGTQLIFVAVFLQLLGEHEQALDAIDAALDVPQLRAHMPYVGNGLLFSDLVAHPQFIQALRRMSLSGE